MDILKKAFENPKTCTINTDSITVYGRTYSNMIIKFTSKKNAIYDLQTTLFYILNKEQDVEEYIKLCQIHKIQSVKYIDRKSIINDIMEYQITGFDGYFIIPQYTNNKHYSIFDRGKHFIIVPSDILSPINIFNFCQLFEVTEGGCYESNQGMVFEKNGSTYTVCDSVSEFTDKDWESVKIIFLNDDNKSFILNNKYVEKLKKNKRIFSLTKNIFGENIIFKNGIIQNKDEIWNKIESLDS